MSGAPLLLGEFSGEGAGHRLADPPRADPPPPWVGASEVWRRAAAVTPRVAPSLPAPPAPNAIKAVQVPRTKRTPSTTPNARAAAVADAVMTPEQGPKESGDHRLPDPPRRSSTAVRVHAEVREPGWLRSLDATATVLASQWADEFDDKQVHASGCSRACTRQASPHGAQGLRHRGEEHRSGRPSSTGFRRPPGLPPPFPGTQRRSRSSADRRGPGARARSRPRPVLWVVRGATTAGSLVRLTRRPTPAAPLEKSGSWSPPDPSADPSLPPRSEMSRDMSPLRRPS